MYAAEKKYPTGEGRVETDRMPGVWSRVLGNTTPQEHQTFGSNIKGTLYTLRNKERSKIKMDKTCIDNDNGLCDRKGILIQEDDTCDRHREDRRKQMLSKFDRRE